MPGHWEGDLVFGTRSSAIATLVERQSRFVLLVSPPHRHTASVVAQALAGAIVTLPAQLCRSLTGDQGKVGEHAWFSVATGVPVYFCDPHSLAAGQQREHQQAAAPVLPPEHRLQGDYAK